MHFGLVEKKLNNIIGKKLKFTEFEYPVGQIPKFTEYISTQVISIKEYEYKTYLVIYFSNGDKVQVFHEGQTDKPGLYVLCIIKYKPCILFCKKCEIIDE